MLPRVKNNNNNNQTQCKKINVDSTANCRSCTNEAGIGTFRTGIEIKTKKELQQKAGEQCSELQKYTATIKPSLDLVPDMLW